MQIYSPVILLGNGVRNNPKLIEHLCSLNIPILTTWMAADLIAEDHPAFCGRPGVLGQRAANIIIQKATHLYSYGARLDSETIAYSYENFAPHAIKYVYDIDKAELGKFPVGWIVDTMPRFDKNPIDPQWLNWCKALYDRFRPELDGDNTGKYVNPFYLMALLNEYSEADDVFAIGASGNAPCTFYQSYKVKKGQRVSNVSTIGAMGADIPMALGAALATGRRTICVTGDGGFQLNAQELETIRRLNLPITFFVLNNGGYNSIRMMQDGRFEGRRVGCDYNSGMTLPELEEITHAYGLLYLSMRVKDLQFFYKCFEAFPMVVEVFVDPAWKQMPRCLTRIVDGELVTDPMQDMTPKIDDLQELMND